MQVSAGIHEFDNMIEQTPSPLGPLNIRKGSSLHTLEYLF